MSAILGTFVNIKTMADGTPRIVLDLQCTLAQVADMGLMPGIPFGLARITKEASVPAAEPAAPAEKAGQLCIMACTFCKEPQFLDWAHEEYGSNIYTEAQAKEWLLGECNISSRKDLDTDSEAAAYFLAKIRAPYLAWKAS